MTCIEQGLIQGGNDRGRVFRGGSIIEAGTEAITGYAYDQGHTSRRRSRPRP